MTRPWKLISTCLALCLAICKEMKKMFEFFYVFKESLLVCGFMTITLPLIALVGYKIIWWFESKFGIWKDEK